MADKDTRAPLLQKITTVPPADSGTAAQELDISFCRETCFIETMDLSGPRLILKFDDSLSILRNVMKIKVGNVLQCVLADLLQKKEMSYTADFEIMSMPVNGEVVTLNCLLKAVADMKKPAVTARIFSLSIGSLKPIVLALTHVNSPTTDPSVKLKIDNRIVLQNSYHLLPGERPTMLLRQIAIEHGAAVFFSRGVLNFLSLDEINKRIPDNRVFRFKNPLAAYQIIDYTHINRENLVADRIVRKYSGFNILKGFIYSTKNDKAASEVTAYDKIEILDNLSLMAVPVLDIMTGGAGHLMPGISLKFQWSLDDSYSDSFLDESLPTQAIVGSVAHYSAGASNYFCRVKLVQIMGDK